MRATSAGAHREAAAQYARALRFSRGVSERSKAELKRDQILIDVHERTLELLVDEAVLAERRAKMESSERPWQPKDRQRSVTLALRAYAKLTTSAATGAVRDPGL